MAWQGKEFALHAGGRGHRVEGMDRTDMMEAAVGR